MITPEIGFAVKRRAALIETHPNGYIKVVISPTVEVHVWPDIPIVKADPYTPIHDHICDYESTVVCGRLDHFTLRTMALGAAVIGAHRVYTVNSGKLEPTDVFLVPVVEQRATYHARDEYTLRVRTFHSVLADDLTMTLMQKTARYELKPRVLVPVDVEPCATFDRATVNDAGLLWGIVDRAVALAKR